MLKLWVPPPLLTGSRLYTALCLDSLARLLNAHPIDLLVNFANSLVNKLVNFAHSVGTMDIYVYAFMLKTRLTVMIANVVIHGLARSLTSLTQLCDG